MSQPKQGNYFMLPNEIFNMDLTASEIALYAFLMRMEDRKTFTCYPAFKTIGEALKMGSKNTVMKYVRLLEEKELIKTEHTIVEHHDGSLRNGNLMFRILPIKQAVDAFHRRQLYNEFFEKAAENLIADEAIKSGGDVMSEKLAKAIEAVSENNAKAISKGLFRYAVQLEMMMRYIAQMHEFTDDELDEMRREAINNVRRTRGRIKLNDIAKGWYNEE